MGKWRVCKQKKGVNHEDSALVQEASRQVLGFFFFFYK